MAGGYLLAQDAQQPDATDAGDDVVFRTETALMEVEVRATLRRGEPVEGLTREDFQFFENGEPHGLATSWDENGRLVEQAEFFEGRQVNFDESSKANTIPATAKQIESTNAESSLR